MTDSEKVSNNLEIQQDEEDDDSSYERQLAQRRVLMKKKSQNIQKTDPGDSPPAISACTPIVIGAAEDVNDEVKAVKEHDEETSPLPMDLEGEEDQEYNETVGHVAHDPFSPDAVNQAPILQLFWQYTDLSVVIACHYLSLHDISSLAQTCHAAHTIFAESSLLLNCKVRTVLQRVTGDFTNIEMQSDLKSRRRAEEQDEEDDNDKRQNNSIPHMLPFMAGTPTGHLQRQIAETFTSFIKAESHHEDWREDPRLKWITSRAGTSPIIGHARLALYLLQGGDVASIPKDIEYLYAGYQHKLYDTPSPFMLFKELCECDVSLSQVPKRLTNALKLMAWVLDMPSHWVKYLADPRYLGYFKPLHFRHGEGPQGRTDFVMLITKMIFNPKLPTCWNVKKHKGMEAPLPAFNDIFAMTEVTSVRTKDPRFYRSLKSHIRLRDTLAKRCPPAEQLPVGSVLPVGLTEIEHPLLGTCYLEARRPRNSGDTNVPLVLWSGAAELRPQLLAVIQVHPEHSRLTLYPMPLWQEWEATVRPLIPTADPQETFETPRAAKKTQRKKRTRRRKDSTTEVKAPDAPQKKKKKKRRTRQVVIDVDMDIDEQEEEY